MSIVLYHIACGQQMSVDGSGYYHTCNGCGTTPTHRAVLLEKVLATRQKPEAKQPGQALQPAEGVA